MDSNDIELRSLKQKIENLERIGKFLKDEVWHLQMDVIALKSVLDDIERKEN